MEIFLQQLLTSVWHTFSVEVVGPGMSSIVVVGPGMSSIVVVGPGMSSIVVVGLGMSSVVVVGPGMSYSDIIINSTSVLGHHCIVITTTICSPLPSAHHLTWCYSYCSYCGCVLESSFGLPVLRHHSLWLTWSSTSTLAKWWSSLALGTQQSEFSEGPMEMQCVILPNFSLHKETNGPELYIIGHIEF